MDKEKQLSSYKEKTDLIATAILNAVAKADEIEKLSAARYREEMNSLRVFHDKWQAHYNKLLDKYPDDEGLRAVEKFNSDTVSYTHLGAPITLSDLKLDGSVLIREGIQPVKIGGVLNELWRACVIDPRLNNRCV